jgi:hypothetical protein
LYIQFYSCISNLILLYIDFNDFCKFVVFLAYKMDVKAHYYSLIYFLRILHYADKHDAYEKSRENPAFLSQHHWCANIRGIILPAARLVFIMALSYKHAVLIQSRLY